MVPEPLGAGKPDAVGELVPDAEVRGALPSLPAGALALAFTASLHAAMTVSSASRPR